MISATGRLRRNSMKAKGFTFIELMMVFALSGILLSFSWPAFSGLFRAYQLETTADHLRNCVDYARTSAIIEKRRYKLEVQKNPAGFALYKEEPASGVATFVSCGGRWMRSLRLPDNISLSGEPSEVYFRPNGTSTSAEFELKDQGGSLILLELQGLYARLRKVEKTV